MSRLALRNKAAAKTSLSALWSSPRVSEAVPHVQDLFPLVELTRGNPGCSESELVRREGSGEDACMAHGVRGDYGY